MNTTTRRFPFSVFRFSLALVFGLSFFCGLPGRTAEAQVRPVYDYGAMGLTQKLRRLQTNKSVMHIGAHPDDEDSGLLAFLARGENARTAYLSLTRGDGGQNIIGSELFESLGVIRTEELLQARRLDGAEQYFTRAFDFGFSKTLAEAKEKWDEKVILCDAVRAIRSFRPLVVVSRFSGTTADGHGQHQFAGYIAPLAVKAAADEKQCADAGAPWEVLKFYVSQSSRDTSQPSLKINTGKYDALLGRSYFEIAMEGRSQHKTQEQGLLELKGEQFSGLNLIDGRVPKKEKETSVFDGIDTSTAASLKLPGLPADVYAGSPDESAKQALEQFNPENPSKIIPILLEGYRRTDVKKMREMAGSKGSIEWSDLLARTDLSVLERKHKEFAEAIKLAAGIQIDALADRETIVQNEDFRTSVKVFFPNAENIRIGEIRLKTPAGWQTSKTEEPKETGQNFRRETASQAAFFSVRPTSAARIGGVYWLDEERDGHMYRWDENKENHTLPFAAPQIAAEVKIEIAGGEITLVQPAEYRFADDIRGEIRREIDLVPEISVGLDQRLLIAPYSEKERKMRLVMNVTKFSEKPLESSRASLNLGAFGEATAVPAQKILNLKKRGEKESIPFELTLPAGTKPGAYFINPNVAFREALTSAEMHTIDYPHIQTRRFYTRVQTKLLVLDLRIEPVRVGYIMGSGDEVPEAIRQMGLNVELLNENDLTSADLSGFDVIVAGIRAYQVRQDLISNNQRILDFVSGGGTLIVQYQRPEYVQKNLQPFPASMNDAQRTTAGATARVVDENARVAVLQPAHPVFNFPNKITDADFAGWVQERNLYNFTTFDSKYTPLLESHDPGEKENNGGMVYAEIGKGRYVYTSYSFFRQLPAGVPGAYRLFANLLSLPKARK